MGWTNAPEGRVSYADYEQRRSLPLGGKVRLSLKRIEQWHDHWEGQVYVSFSGGKHSTALLHLVRSIYPSVPAVFVDTGVELPEVRRFVRTIANVTWVRPKLNFREVIERYGYPIISKRVASFIREARMTTPGGKQTRRLRLEGLRADGSYQRNWQIPAKWRYLLKAPFRISEECCYALKKAPAHAYTKATGRRPYIATTAVESLSRKLVYLQYGCNAFKAKHPRSTPMAVWDETDTWAYIHKHKLPYCQLYDMGWESTGCAFCMFGLQSEPIPNRFQRLAIHHPALHAYCLDKLGIRAVLDYLGLPHSPEQSLLPMADAVSMAR